MATTVNVSAIEKARKMVKSALEFLEGLSKEAGEKVIEATAAVEATATPKKEVLASTSKKEAEGINRSEKIREYFEKQGMSVRNKDVVDYIKKTYNTEVGPAHVSIIRKNMTKDKTVKTDKVKAKVQKTEPKTEKADDGLPMHTLCTRLLKKYNARGGLKLSELTDLVIKSGYSYKGDKGRDGVLQIVYQALHHLCREESHVGYKGETPVIVKDPTSKRYRLNPKAKKVA